MDRLATFEEQKKIEMETQRKLTDQRLANLKKQDESSSLAKKLSKRARKKLDKQLADKNLSEVEKKILKD